MRTATTAPAAIAYTRVSTDEQTASGLGLDAQRAAIATAAARLGLEIRETFSDEGISGSAGIEKRPGLLAAVESLRAGDVLLVAKRDRIARDCLLAAWVEKEAARIGARIVSAAGEGSESDDPTAVLMRRIVDAFAEYERRVIAARTTAALARKKAAGKVAGTAPFGFSADADGTLVPVPAELDALARMADLRESGLSFRAVAATLTAEGFRNRRGSAWNAASIRSILRTRDGRAEVAA